jgi:SAM-dependent methyltransferase
MTIDDSRTRAAEIAAIFDRLQTEVRATLGVDSHEGEADAWSRTREKAEQRWPVTGDRPFRSRPGPVGRLRASLLRPVKTVVRRLVRWYVEPIAVDQRAFNALTLQLLDQLHQRTSSIVTEIKPLRDQIGVAQRRLAELDDRIARVERNRDRPGLGSGNVPVAAAGPSGFDHFACEVRLRGPSEIVRSKQVQYVDLLAGCAPVLDLGCGRGELLALLREAGVEGRGVDIDADMVDAACSRGLQVTRGDALHILGDMADGSLGAVAALQFVEHLSAAQLLRLFGLAAAKIRTGGVLLIETINPLSFVALRHFYADLTHVQPLVPDTLQALAQQAGFSNIEIRFLNPPSEAEALQRVELPEGAQFAAARRALDANLERLNAVVFGPQDYALIARR